MALVVHFDTINLDQGEFGTKWRHPHSCLWTLLMVIDKDIQDYVLPGGVPHHRHPW